MGAASDCGCWLGGLWFELTPLGRSMLELGRRGTLRALLFCHAFWDMDLSGFVRVNPRGHAHRVVHGPRRCDTGDALETGVHDVRMAHLWPLRWFGILEYRGPEETLDVA